MAFAIEVMLTIDIRRHCNIEEPTTVIRTSAPTTFVFLPPLYFSVALESLAARRFPAVVCKRIASPDLGLTCGLGRFMSRPRANVASDPLMAFSVWSIVKIFFPLRLSDRQSIGAETPACSESWRRLDLMNVSTSAALEYGTTVQLE